MALRDEWWFGYVNHLETATLVAEDSYVETPASNVYDYRAENVWRVSASTMRLDADLGSSKSSQALLLRLPVANDLSQPFAADDEVEVSFSDVQAGDSELGSWTVPVGAQDVGTGCIPYLAATAITARYVRIDLPASVDIDHLYLGPVFLPEKNFSRGALIDIKDQSVSELSLFGSVNVTPGATIDIFESQFQVWSEDDYQLWRRFVRRTGKIRPFIFGTSQTTNVAEAYLAHFTALPSFRITDSIYQARLSLEAFR